MAQKFCLQTADSTHVLYAVRVADGHSKEKPSPSDGDLWIDQFLGLPINHVILTKRLNMDDSAVLDQYRGFVESALAGGDEDSVRKIAALCNGDIDHLVCSMIHRTLFPDKINLLHKSAQYSRDIIAKTHSWVSPRMFEIENEGLYIECLIKLVKLQPMKSYQRWAFYRFMNFLLDKRVQQSNLDLSYLANFMDELRTMLRKLHYDDRQGIRPTSRRIDGNAFYCEANEDACFLASWFIIESAKYCVCHELVPLSAANQFLNLLRKEIMMPFTWDTKASRRIFSNFIYCLDKLICDRVSEASTCQNTYSDPNSGKQFYRANSYTFRSWFSKNRLNMATLNLAIDDPASSWRDSSARLCAYSRVDTKDRYSLLTLLAQSAKQLRDLPALYGLRTLTDLPSKNTTEYPSITAMIFNLEGRHQEAYDCLQKDEMAELDLTELIDACIELDILDKNTCRVEQLKSETTKSLYQNYILSRSQDIDISARYRETKTWLSSWSSTQDISSSVIVTQPIARQLDIFVPTCLNLISRAPDETRGQLITFTESILNQDLVAQSLFPPFYLNDSIKTYSLLLEMFRSGTKIDHHIVKTHEKDLRWNNRMFRHLCDLNLIEKLRQCQPESVDIIQLAAARYHRRHGNHGRASVIAQNLMDNSLSEATKTLSSLLMLNKSLDRVEKFSYFLDLSSRISSLTLEKSCQSELIAKIARKLVRILLEQGGDVYKPSGSDSILERCLSASTNMIFDETLKSFPSAELQAHISNSSYTYRAKTMLLLSRQNNRQLEGSPKDETLISLVFEFDMKLLIVLCESQLSEHKSSALECATCILRTIIENGSHLKAKKMHEKFGSPEFIKSTISVWVAIKTNLISIISYQKSIEAEWRSALIEVMKYMGESYPDLFTYSILVNRLDLQNELYHLTDEPTCQRAQEPCAILLQASVSSSDGREHQRKQRECQRRLEFWNELFNHIKDHTKSSEKPSWSETVVETERFLREIRRISFLCGEYLRTLTFKIPKRLYEYLDTFSRVCDAESGAVKGRLRNEELDRRLKGICDGAINSIKVLLTYGKRIGDSHMTKYDVWFCNTFGKQLKELDYRLSLLAEKRPLVLKDLERLVKSITELIAVCRNTLLDYNHSNRQKLYMELISPTLSRLKPSLIPMPDCHERQMNSVNGSTVTIHKIGQTINLILSKTCPKKLKLVGSDGISRSFLLKAHEDLRLDQLMMELFANMNTLLASKANKQDNQILYRIRRYSITPVSSRSGLLQWIEATSLCSSHRAWLNGPNGKRVVASMFATTCEQLCNRAKEDGSKDPSLASAHPHCQAPETVQTTDLFYQLLWARTRPTRKPVTEIRPFYGNILKYRTEFKPTLFASIVEQLTRRMPSKLVINQLLYKCNNAHSYWLKSRQFVRSCATMSIVGYIIGLGDRHPENILLDHTNGEIIHIDYNICFELGRTLSIPERVPFRLTQNMIHVFGYAGLEGSFSFACRDVLELMQASKSTLLHLMDPVNLSFMVGKAADKQSDGASARADAKGAKLGSCRKTHKVVDINTDMCSQEFEELASDVDARLTLKPFEENPVRAEQLAPQSTLVAMEQCWSGAQTALQPPQSYDLQENIKTPTKILAKTAASMHKRVSDKLSGTDAILIRHWLEHKQATSGQQQQTCTSLSTQEQVEALIAEAVSLKNKAAMYEGWVPWI